MAPTTETSTRPRPPSRADASGRFWHLVIGFGIGFVLGALSTHYSGGNWLLGGFIGGISGLAGALTMNPWFAGAVAGFLNSVLSDIAAGGIHNIDWKKAVLAMGVGALSGGIVGWAANRIVNSFFGSKMGSTIADGVVDWSDEWGDEVVGAASGVFFDGIITNWPF